ncbi:CoA transferase [Mycolicibacterium murale]|uniref:CoA transferase n=1 Tax=Mycolicibacterium murale TaxID=182220 RepID=A0A7I9WMA6_9MYCO|nr:CoA transferase [Mycolicibacterium murale]MCV7180412.1 CoA transferase [Mycolicibacterium murale]GFG58719.1 CoA transferase [Mycolicibacterium murale]
MTTDSATNGRLLSGVRVLDFGRVLAGPYAARHLADLGADVIKIERPVYGDDTRMDPYIYEDGLSAGFMQLNWGKKSLSIDLRHADAKAIIRELVAKSDVVIENFRPGVMKKLGFGYDQLVHTNPALIMCSVSAYGQTGPYAQRAGYGPVTEAAAGVPELSGESDGPPMPTVLPIADNMASGLALAAICAALFHRERTGEGEYIDISLLEAAFQMHDMAVQQYLASDGTVAMTRRGIRDVTWVPWGFFANGPDWVCIMAGNDSSWRSVAELLGRADLLDDPQFADYEGRSANRDVIYRAVEEWVAAQPSALAAVDALVAAGVPAERVNTIGQAVEHPQIQARNMLPTFNHPVVGEVRVMNSGITLRNTSASVRGSAPDLGEHNREILAELLGRDTAEITRLTEEGVLFEHPRVAGS